MLLSDFSFAILDSVDSTNNYAMAKIHAGLAKHGDAFFAHVQTNGKGQRGKIWQTGHGENIAMSIILEINTLKHTDQFHLSAAISLACFDLFNKNAIEETAIKWPNDLYWRDRKAGGILIENVIRGTNWKWAVVGIGININQVKFSETLKNPVSLKQITGKSYDIINLAKELHLLVMKRVSEINTQLFAVLLNEYNERLYKKNEKVVGRYQQKEIDFIIKNVNEKGQLEITGAEKNELNFGEIEFL